MASGFRKWRQRRILRKAKLDQSLWQVAVSRCRFLHGLSDDEYGRLRELVVLFLYFKQIHGAGDLELVDEMRVYIALQACILILNLDLDYYKGWSEIIVYPAEFIPKHEYTDEAGVVHVSAEAFAGESWLQGPVILSWEDVNLSGREDGTNVVIHEFAHKIDMLNGDANGFPPIHKEMSRTAWVDVFSKAYTEFCQKVDSGHTTSIDSYAAENPAEFFAVMSEVFFEMPLTVSKGFPDVYSQLKAFYRQDPLMRLGR